MNKKILDVKNVDLSYDNKKTYVLKDISFSVFSGEVLSIIGLNGSGKSSLLKIIAKVQKQSSGSIVRKYKNLSYVPQKMNIEDSFPILVKEFIQIYNDSVSISEIKDLLKKFNSGNILDKKLETLSGGQLQKMLIISALLDNPDIILLDEPTAGVDIIGEEKFYEIIKEVKKNFPKISIILVSHNIHLVYKNSDKVICLHENNFCCHGTPHEVRSNENVKNIFGKYTLPYEHHPHSLHEHKNCNH
ncbi:MAG: metal ABC transporter ATP-binding protein [Candidatus Gracilibacteria bacterium]|nr:metal ABC transporter ATP-binding protein [Candidatus Gracilibacteria bacterium]